MPPADPARAPLSPRCREGDPSSALRSLPQESAASRLRALAENRLKPVGASPSGSCLTWARKDTEGINNPLLSCRPVLTRPHPTSSETAARRSRAHAVEGDASRASPVAGDSGIVTSRGRRAARQACAACLSEVPAAVSELGCHLTGREGHEVPRRPAPRAHLRARARGVRSPRHAARRSESEGPCGGSARGVHAQAEALSGFALGTPQPDGEASVTPRVAAAPCPPRARRLGPTRRAVAISRAARSRSRTSAGVPCEARPRRVRGHHGPAVTGVLLNLGWRQEQGRSIRPASAATLSPDTQPCCFRRSSRTSAHTCPSG